MENQDNRPVEEPAVAQETEDYAFGPETEAETKTEAEGATETAEMFFDMPSEKKAKRKKGKKKNKDKGQSAEAVQEEVIGTAEIRTVFVASKAWKPCSETPCARRWSCSRWRQPRRTL